MMKRDNRVSVRVWGDFACFTRPEMKVERVSYPIMTPSAARGVLEAIFWEPQMCYRIDQILVVKKGPLAQLPPQRGLGRHQHRFGEVMDDRQVSRQIL